MRKISITDKLQTEKPVLEIKGHEFEIDNSKNAVLAFNETDKSGMNQVEIIDEAIRIFAGEKALGEIQDMELSYRDYERVFTGIMALTNEESYEDTESRFQRAGR